MSLSDRVMATSVPIPVPARAWFCTAVYSWGFASQELLHFMGFLSVLSFGILSLEQHRSSKRRIGDWANTFARGIRVSQVDLGPQSFHTGCGQQSYIDGSNSWK